MVPWSSTALYVTVGTSTHWQWSDDNWQPCMWLLEHPHIDNGPTIIDSLICDCWNIHTLTMVPRSSTALSVTVGSTQAVLPPTAPTRVLSHAVRLTSWLDKFLYRIHTFTSYISLCHLDIHHTCTHTCTHARIDTHIHTDLMMYIFCNHVVGPKRVHR